MLLMLLARELRSLRASEACGAAAAGRMIPSQSNDRTRWKVLISSPWEDRQSTIGCCQALCEGVQEGRGEAP